MNFERKILILVVLLIGMTRISAQCDAEDLCAEQVYFDSIMDPNPVIADCFDFENTAFYSFVTNTSMNNFGGVTISVTATDCADPLNNDSIGITVIELINANGNPCEPMNWSTNLGCAGGNAGVVMNIDDVDLSNDTGYAVIVGNDQDPGTQGCFYNIEIEGSWVDIDACCDSDITLGDLVDVTAEGSDNGYHWTADTPASISDPNIADPTIGATSTTIMTVEGEVGGCDVTDQITIYVGPPIEVLNTFTPNGDGINDTFEIVGISDFENAQVTIYDRWGQLIFKSIGYTRKWDGTNKGNKLPPATYYYVIELNSLDVEIEPYTGWVTILY